MEPNNIRTTVQHLSPEARRMLINYGGSQPGQRAPQGADDLVIGELQAAGIVTERRNLTGRGGVARDLVICDALDAL